MKIDNGMMMHHSQRRAAVAGSARSMSTPTTPSNIPTAVT
jgi:hypothetical protein